MLPTDPDLPAGARVGVVAAAATADRYEIWWTNEVGVTEEVQFLYSAPHRWQVCQWLLRCREDLVVRFGRGRLEFTRSDGSEWAGPCPLLPPGMREASFAQVG